MQGKEWLSVGGGGVQGKGLAREEEGDKEGIVRKVGKRRESQGEEKRGRDLGFFRWTFRTPSGIEIHILN